MGLGMSKNKTHVMRVLNISQQLINIHVKPPQGDFYRHEQQVSLRPGQDALLPKDHLRQDQVNNLRARKVIRVIYDSEVAEELV